MTIKIRTHRNENQVADLKAKINTKRIKKKMVANLNIRRERVASFNNRKSLEITQ